MRIPKEVKIGIIVTASLAFLIYGINFLKGRNVFTNERVFYGVYPHIDGLIKTNPVLINGLNVGMVKETKLIHDGSGRILVSFSIIDPNLQLPENSVAKIISSDLLGSKAINLLLGDANSYLEKNDTLFTDVELSLTEEVNRQVKPLKDKAERLISSVDTVLTVVHAILDEDTQADLDASFERIRMAIFNLERTSKRLDTLVSDEKDRLSRIFRNVESITLNLHQNNDHISAVMANLHTVTDSIAKVDFAATLGKVDKTLSDFNDIMARVNSGEGTVGMLLNNDSLYLNLQNSALDLDKLLIDMKENPGRYVHFSIFGKKN